MSTEAAQVVFPQPLTQDGLPDPELFALTRDRPVLPVVTTGGTPAWLVSSDELVREVLSDHSRFSNMIDPSAINSRANMVVLDPPNHTRLRKLVAQGFTSRRVRAFQSTLEVLIAAVLDGMERAGSPLDLVEHFARPLPVRVICNVLGAPVDDQGDLIRWTNVFTAMTAYTSDEITTAVEQMHAYLQRMVAQRRHELGDDLLSDLIRARDGGDALSEDELVATLGLLMVAGHETTVKALTRGVLVLTTSGQWQRLASGEVAAEQVVEEVLRHQAPIDTALFRWAKSDTELGGAPIKAGDQVFVSLHLANFDDATRQDPAVFDPERSDQGHMTFGHGVHFCVGANLARAELATAFGRLARRFPGLHLAVGVEELNWSVGSMLNAPTALPVAW